MNKDIVTNEEKQKTDFYATNEFLSRDNNDDNCHFSLLKKTYANKKIMKKLYINIVSFMFSLVLLFSPVLDSWRGQNLIVAQAHSGRTDSYGGHKDNRNKSGLGSYHYHCGGYPAHLHKDGVCPYSSGNVESSEKTNTKKETIKAVQKALNDLGYDCGKADGICGKKTKAALKEFQKDNNLTVDGIIGKQVKKALNIN